MDSRYAAGEIVTTVVRSNPLDVVAQQAVAMAALDEWRVEDLAALLRRAHPFRDLGGRSLEAVLDMLSGRYRRTSSASCRRGSSGTG